MDPSLNSMPMDLLNATEHPHRVIRRRQIKLMHSESRWVKPKARVQRWLPEITNEAEVHMATYPL